MLQAGPPDAAAKQERAPEAWGKSGDRREGTGGGGGGSEGYPRLFPALAPTPQQRILPLASVGVLKPFFIAYSLPNQVALLAWEGNQKKQGAHHGGDTAAADGGHVSCGGSLFRGDSVLLRQHLFPNEPEPPDLLTWLLLDPSRSPARHPDPSAFRQAAPSSGRKWNFPFLPH